MGYALVDDGVLNEIALAVRFAHKDSSDTTYKFSELADVIKDIPAPIYDANIAAIWNMYINPNKSSIYRDDYGIIKSFPSLFFRSNTIIQSVYYLSCSVISSAAFQGCTALREVSFPKCSVIQDYAFGECTMLSSVSFPICSSIGASAFMYCYSLSNISFPKCKTIGAQAFYYCSSLFDINLPECSIIGSSAFYNCQSLKFINFEACNAIYNSAFQHCINLLVASFPQCSSIYYYAFASCSRLKKIYFNSVVTFYHYSIFYICDDLTDIYLSGSGVCVASFSPVYYSRFFNRTSNLSHIYVPSMYYEAYLSDSFWSYYSSLITVSEI